MIFHWNTDPELLKIGGVALRYYSLLFVAGVYTAYLIVKKIYKQNFFPLGELESFSIYIFIGLIAGARLGHCLFYDFDYYSAHISEIFLPFAFYPNGFQFTGYQGLSSHGGGIGIIISLFVWKLRNKTHSLFPPLDAIAVAAPLTAAFIRLGNFMNSEIIGKPTDGTWGVIFDRIDKSPRHPGQLYESLSYLTLFFVMLILYKKTNLFRIKGKLFGIFLAAVFSIRILIEFFKENQSAFESSMPLNMGQLLSIPFIIAGIYLMLRKNRLSKSL